MKKLLFILFTLQFWLQSYAQVKFEKAYFIDNNNVRTECFIKNKDSYYSPKSFEYKLNEEESTISIGEIKNIKEFGFDNSIKFERYLLNVDMSSSIVDKLSDKSEPEWEEKTIFIKVLIEGDATLYEYVEPNLKRYFYKVMNSPIRQLVYKKYFVKNSDHSELAVNKQYQSQLWSGLNCENVTMAEILKMEYKRKELLNYFVKYNKSKNNAAVNYGQKMTKGSFNLKLKGGVNVSPNENYVYGGDRKVEYFGDKLFPNYGAEFEYCLPFNRNKWSIYMDVNYQNYKYETVFIDQYSTVFEKTYKTTNSINKVVPNMGFRYSMYLNDNSKIFINIGLIRTYGLGYSYNHKYNVEFRRSGGGFTEYSLVLGYTLFNNKKQKTK
ncbi:hypothetical protein ACFX5E_04960 [Flavobacterium sp. LS2P90]|uniref:Outer membrane protein beta-barrel domain-containing protein n=1 Tax=Flavobacterium xylosi TaxID=3230415 RepID=A0ABW6HTZ6_9FLAO